MPKIKTIKSIAKRFKKISNKKIKCKKSNLRHILRKKTSKRKRILRKKKILCNIKISNFLYYKNK